MTLNYTNNHDGIDEEFQAYAQKILEGLLPSVDELKEKHGMGQVQDGLNRVHGYIQGEESYGTNPVAREVVKRIRDDCREVQKKVLAGLQTYAMLLKANEK